MSLELVELFFLLNTIMTLSGKMNFYFPCNALSVFSLENISLNLSEVSQQYYLITETHETF